ncbi:MAG: sodium:solute symporter [Bacteroidota bacterium]
MNYLDIIIIVVYSAGLLGLGYFFKGQKDTKDYFLGGKSFGWFELGLSTMATQLSAISFISASAFVGIRKGGGLQWLSYEFAVPIAMILLIVVIMPKIYGAGITSIYEYLERRFGSSTRVIISIVFQFSRAFATAIMIYAVALILSAVFSIPIWATLLITGVITLIYSYQGGMKAVVWGDAIQMVIIFIGILVCLFYGLDKLGGWDVFLESVDRSRLDVVNFDDWGISLNADEKSAKGNEFGFWPMLLGGLFLYMSYYGCDQSQAQRALSARNFGQVKRMLLFNGLMRFPITVCYCMMGLVIGTLAMSEPEFLAKIPADQPDRLMPLFIANYLPHGILGLLIVAILSAAMSSLSSAINSLSAATMEDLIYRNKKAESDEALATKKLRYSKYLSLAWGVACIIVAFFSGQIADTVIEAINKVGSLFYGPILATFLLALTTKKTNGIGMNAGLLSGVGVNLILWLFFIDNVFWFWWNAIGGIVTMAIALIVSLLIGQGQSGNSETRNDQKKWLSLENLILLVYFVVIVAFSIMLPQFF